MADRAEAELTSMDKPISGNVYTGAGETEAVRLQARAAECMLQQYPQVKFHIFSGNGQAVTDQLESGILDFGLLFEPSDNTKYSYISLPTANASLFVSEGCGYALCLDRIINLTEDSNLVFKPLVPELRTRVNLVWKSNRHFSSAASRYLEILRRQIGAENACKSVEAGKTL